MATRPSGAQRVGVLFVHGVGSQPESETVRFFGDPLLAWLRAWYGPRAGDLIVSSRLTYGDESGRPARVHIDLPPSGSHAATTWVLAEAWWAQRLEAPSYLRMLRWSGRRLIRNLTRTAVRAISSTRAVGRDGTLERRVLRQLLHLMQALVLLAGYAAAAIVGYPLLFALFLIALIPYEPLQKLILVVVAKAFFVENLGDFHVYLTDDIQALHVRNAVLSGIRTLVEVERCRYVAVVGHSQGCVVAFDALTSGDPAVKHVRLLVTLGGALNDAWLLKRRDLRRLEGALPPRVKWIDAWSTYDPVPNGDLVRGFAPKVIELRATNRMNVVADHGSYLENSEEILATLALRIDRPTRVSRSRFWRHPREARRWVQRRHDRLLALVAWRTAAMTLTAWAVALRGDTNFADGRALVGWASALPGITGILRVLDLVAGVVRSGLGLAGGGGWIVWAALGGYAGVVFLVTWLAFLEPRRKTPRKRPESPRLPRTQRLVRFIVSRLPARWGPTATAALQWLLGTPPWGTGFLAGAAQLSAPLVGALVLLAFFYVPDLVALALGLALWGVLATATYLVATHYVFDPWDRDEARASASPLPPPPNQRGQIAWRSAVVLGTIALTALAIAALGPVPPRSFFGL